MNKNTEDAEHILVCLSPSPSNPKVITAAAKMADAFHATLTAIYVRPTNNDTLSDEDKSRLQSNIRFDSGGGSCISTQALALQAIQNAYQSTSSAISQAIKKNRAKIKYNTIVYLINEQ